MEFWASSSFLISQTFVLAGFILLGITYLIGSRNKQLTFVIVSNLMFITGFILLGGYTAAVMVSIGIVRDITSRIINHYRAPEKISQTSKLDWFLLILWLSLQTIGLIFTYTDIFSLLPFIGATIFTITIWQKNLSIYKLWGIFDPMLFFVYNIHIGNLLGAAMEPVIITFAIIGLTRHLRTNKKLKIK